MLGRTGLLGCQLTWAANLPHLLRRCGEPRTQWVGSGRAGERGHVSCAAESPGTELPWPLGGAREHRVLGEERGAPPRGTAGPQTQAARTRKLGTLATCPASKAPGDNSIGGSHAEDKLSRASFGVSPFPAQRGGRGVPKCITRPAPLMLKEPEGTAEGGD